ncbi:MAG: hypothetical protein ACRC28_12060 [Clostridium sp.]|uniref:hypothetical protein n=1 Tax=Clostridium sp. TaxID=1506 RepID=UPI003F30BECF
MKFIEAYLEKCLRDKGFHKKTSLIAGVVIGIIFYIINVFSGMSMDVALVTGIATIITFTIVWYVVIKRLHKSFASQRGLVDTKEIMEDRDKKRENAKRLMEKRNSKKNKRKN